MGWYVDAAVSGACYGLLSGLLVPELIARVPEPPPEPDAGPDAEPGAGPAGLGAELTPEPPAQPAVGPVTDPTTEPPPALAADQRTGVPQEPPKELYADIARLRGLRPKASLATAVVAALLAGRVGWSPELSFLLYLAPVGVALAIVDWRTRLLPTKVIAPSYAVVIALVLLSAWLDSDPHALATAGWGWLVAGGTFFVLWFIYPRGMGYGDVRLSGLLGIALGYLGWPELLTGVYAGFLLGGVGGLLLSTLRMVDRKAYPFGPFMLVGAVLGVVVGPWVGAWYR